MTWWQLPVRTGAQSAAGGLALACCAFAVFVLGQLLAAFAWLRRRLPRVLRCAPWTAGEVDPVTSWQLFPAAAALVPAATVGRRPRGVGRALGAAVAIELAILGVGALGLAASRSRPEPGRTPAAVDERLTSFWCRSLLAPVVASSER